LQHYVEPQSKALMLTQQSTDSFALGMRFIPRPGRDPRSSELQNIG
jgi:hypothetical protein